MKKHKVSTYERDVVGWWERRKGQEINDELIEIFAPFFWRRSQKELLEVMRDMMGRSRK